MSKCKLYLFGIFLLTLAIPAQSETNPIKHKAVVTVKERLVLMPLRVPEENKNLAGTMETALVEGLQQKYEVFSGEKVSQKAHRIFLDESRNTSHTECDETRCMQKIAEAFQSELIATAAVTKQEDGYFIALSIQNIFDNKVVYSKSVPCQNCNAYQLVEKLKELVSKSPTNEKDNISESDLWAQVEKVDRIEEYETYLSKYPRGKNVLVANARIKKLKSIASKELSAWKHAQQLNTIKSYQTYIQEFPNGLHADFAQAAIYNLAPSQENDSVSAKVQIDLAQAYLYGNGVPQNSAKAFALTRQLAIQGYADAQYSLGLMYFSGQGIAKDESKAFEWFQKSAMQGNADAQVILAAMYEEGQVITKDESKAFAWYQKSAMQGNADAQFALGVRHFNGQGVAKDESKAFEWVQKSAIQGKANAQGALGSMYLNGQGVARDETKAFEWFQKSAIQGNATGQYYLGEMYSKGQGVAKDDSKAFDWFEKSATQNYAQSYNAFDYRLLERHERIPEAVAMLEKAIKLAPDNYDIMDSLGWGYYLSGKKEEALNLLKRAFNGNPRPEMAAHLGEVLWIMGNKTEGEKVWRDALNKNPENESLKEVIKRFIL
jgi:hypothetical protein